MESDDYLEIAGILQKLGRNSEAIDLLKQLIAKNPSLDWFERAHFFSIYKAKLDKFRHTLSRLSAERIKATSPILCAKIDEEKAKVARELEDLCTETLDLIDNVLLKNCDGLQGQVFFEKMRGDLFRYLAENSEGDENVKHTDEAEKAYSKAMDLAVNLPVSDQARLGTFLNYAVFLYEHRSNASRASELVRQAINSVGSEIDQLSANSKAETLEIVKVMRTNLMEWDEPEEEEEEA